MEDTYNTEDSYETRKRGRDEHDLVAYPKRVNFGTKPGHYLVKILVPPTVAGSIIGRGGAQIKELQLTYDVVIKLSQNQQFYPEGAKTFTSGERIVLVTGPPEQLCKVAEFIHSLVRNPPQNQQASDILDTPGRRLQMMKLVVTNTTAGMIIGKGGATVKSLNETYDVRIQASQKDDVVMGERVITILGAEDGVNKTMEYIIKEKFRDDPTSTSITNLDYSSYLDPNGMGLGMNNMGSAGSLNYGSFDGGQDMSQVNLIQTLLQNQNQQQSPQSQGNHYGSYQSAGYGGSGGNSGGGYNSLGSQVLQQQQQQQQQTQQQAQSQQAGGTGNNTAEVIARVLQALPNNALANTNTTTLANTIMLIQALSGNNSSGNSTGMPQVSQQRMSSANQHKAQLKPFIPRPDDVKFKVEIPDSLVGRILGRLGSTITEIQNTSGCEVKFSQRGEYVPGTQNRLLYVCGQAQGCKIAQQHILSKIEGDAGDVSSSDFVFEQIPNN